MKAFVVDNYKKKGALRLVNLPEPELRDDEWFGFMQLP